MAITKSIRQEIFQRDNFTCQFCKRSLFSHDVILQVDHKISISQGGTNDIQNLITLCGECNRTKHYRNYDEFVDEYETQAHPVRRVRISKNLSVKTLAKLADIGVQTLIKIEQFYQVGEPCYSRVTNVLGLNYEEVKLLNTR